MQNRSPVTYEETAAGVIQTDPVSLTEELRNRAKSELFEDENKIIQSLKELRSMLKEEQNLRWQDEDPFLLAFLRVKKFDVERAFSLIKRMYAAFGRHGHVYYNLTSDYLRTLMEENCFCVLPDRHDDGSVVAILRFSTCDSRIFSPEERLVMATLGLLIALRDPSTQIAGIRVIIDFKGFGLSHFVQATPNVILFMHDIMQSTLPLRMRSVHITNQNFLFPYMWKIFKQFVSKKIRERIHIHGNDIKSLHKVINPRILPAEWDGERPPFDNTEWRRTMESSFDYINHVLSFGYEKYLTKHRKNSIHNIT